MKKNKYDDLNKTILVTKNPVIEYAENPNHLPLTNEAVIELRKGMKELQPEFIRTLTNLETKSLNNNDAVFSDLYKLVYNKDLLFHALGNIMQKPGSLTKGVDQKSTDLVSAETIHEISKKLIKGEFQFKPIRRIFIDKTGQKRDVNKEAIKFYLENKLTKEKQKELKIRPLGILTTNDKIVSEAVRLILNAIYEPEFKKLELNFGFRPHRGCHDAIKHHVEKAKAHTYAIEADITGAFDNVNHDKLIQILSKKINDVRFLKLIRDGLKAGIFFAGSIEEAKIGTVQGSNVSPLLYNIYFHEFDLFINSEFKIMINKINNREKRIDYPYNSYYTNITKEKQRLKRDEYYEATTLTLRTFGKDSTQHKQAISNFARINKEYKKLDKIQKATPRFSKGRAKLRFTYTRFADDWLFSSNASLKKTQEFKELFTKWIKDNLLLDLSEQKTKITPLNKKEHKVQFLGFNLAYFSYKSLIIRKFGPFKSVRPFILNRTKTIRILRGLPEFKARTSIRIATPTLICSIDKDRLLPRLEQARFIKKKRNQHFGRSKSEWSTLEIPEIITRYNQIIRGYVNYYAHVIKYTSELNFIIYLLQYSCLHTLANKLNTTISKVIKKFGKYPIVKWVPEIETKDIHGQLMRTYGTEQSTKLLSWKDVQAIIFKIKTKKQKIIQPGYYTPLERICQIKCNWRTRFKLTSHCAICGSTDNINYHHVRHIRVGKVEGFLQVMKQLNRKQIPCCSSCHKKIHRGEYNGLKLSDLYDERLIIL